MEQDHCADWTNDVKVGKFSQKGHKIRTKEQHGRC